MRRNTLPIKNNRPQNPNTSTRRTILNHLNKMNQMMNIPPPRLIIATNNVNRNPPIQLNLNSQVNRINNVDSDQDYFDDYIMNDSQSQESQGSDDEYFVSHFVEKFDKDRGATFGEIASLPVSKVQKKLQGVCSICLQQWKTHQQYTILPCAHKFHQPCIQDWLQKKNKCPCCNSAVFQ